MKGQVKLVFIILIISLFFPIFPLKLNTSIPTEVKTKSSDSINLSNSNGNYLIITSNTYENSLLPLKLWKSQKGLDARIKTIEEIELAYPGEDIQEKMKNCIKDQYFNSSVKWVLLAGDHDVIPGRYVYAPEDYVDDGNVVSCDTYFADLDNDWDLNNDDRWGYNGDNYDFNSEVYIGRLTADTINEMEHLVNRILKYEKYPSVGDWMEMALYSGAFICFQEDWNGDNVVDLREIDGNEYGNYLKERIPENWSYVTLGESEGLDSTDFAYNKSLTTTNLKDYINNGASIGVIDGHGNPTGIYRMVWTEDQDDDGLFDWDGSPYEGGIPEDTANYPILWSTSMDHIKPIEDRLGLYFLLGCSNGQFDFHQDCLAEYYLKDSAIASIAGSYVTWAEDNWTARPEGGWYSQGLCTRFFDELFECKHPGMALALAKEDYVNDRNSSGIPPVQPEWENKTLKQYNLFGDPEIPIWLGKPKFLNASYTNHTSSMTIKITTTSKPVENVTVSVTIDDNLAFLGSTDETGSLVIPYNYDQLSEYILTATKVGYVPIITNEKSPIKNPAIPSFNPLMLLLISFISVSFLILNQQKKLQ
jgi:hypothetical protein